MTSSPPVAAHLAAGVPLGEAGPRSTRRLGDARAPAAAHRGGGASSAHVLYRDGFGNLGLNFSHADLAARGPAASATPVAAAAGAPSPRRFVRTFADGAPGELIVYEDAYRRLAVAVSHGDAAARLGLRPGDELRIEPA